VFFGRSAVGAFTDQHQRIPLGVAAWASVALESARLCAGAPVANRMKDGFPAVIARRAHGLEDRGS
jgi:hypothetical protein